MIAALARVVGIIVHNWPLKLFAIVLASLLYAGFVLSQSARTFSQSVPIETANQASDIFVLSDLGAVTSIRYVVPDDLGLRVDTSSFLPTVDLADIDPTGGPVSVAVDIATTDPRIQVLDYTPRRITVTLDRVTSRSVPIRPMIIGDVPAGFDLGDPQVDETSATVSGPKSIVDRVDRVEAPVRIDPSGIDVNRQVQLVPVDGEGNALLSVDVEPTSVQVRVAVFTDRRTKTLPVNPVVTGTPAAGFEVASITVDPIVVSVEGDANDLSTLERADTQSVSISGASSDVVATVALNLPDGVQALGSGQVGVTVRLRPLTSSRTLEAGLVLVGAQADRIYTLSTDRVLVTVGGSVADLDRLSGATLVLTLNVAGLGPGNHDLVPIANLTTGLLLISVSPSPVTVTISIAAASPAPSASP
jgi:YbbR domain-containing protein